MQNLQRYWWKYDSVIYSTIVSLTSYRAGLHNESCKSWRNFVRECILYLWDDQTCHTIFLLSWAFCLNCVACKQKIQTFLHNGVVISSKFSVLKCCHVVCRCLNCFLVNGVMVHQNLVWCSVLVDIFIQIIVMLRASRRLLEQNVFRETHAMLTQILTKNYKGMKVRLIESRLI